ncbi:unnamed protein product [Gadus morhua 'NCC']
MQTSVAVWRDSGSGDKWVIPSQPEGSVPRRMDHHLGVVMAGQRRRCVRHAATRRKRRRRQSPLDSTKGCEAHRRHLRQQPRPPRPPPPPPVPVHITGSSLSF